MLGHKIVIVMNSRLQKHGSFEDFMIGMARSARVRKMELSYIFPDVGTPDVVRLIEAEQAKVYTVSSPWDSWAGSSALLRQLTALRPDVVNFHFCDFPLILPVHLACRIQGIKVVSHYYGEIRSLNLLRWKNRHFSVLRLLSFFINQIVTISQANKRFLEALHIRTPVEMIYCGIDTVNFMREAAPLTQTESGAAVRPISFLYLGQLVHRKQVPTLIHAFALLNKQLPEARLTIVGGGPEDGQCKKLAGELGVSDTIKFAGLLSEYPFDLLKRSDILVSASESESFGLVFAEAMCAGLPVIACAVGGIPEVVDDGVTGLLVPPHEPAALAEAMLALARDPERCRQMGREGRRRVTSLFNLADKVESNLDLLDRVVVRA